MNIKTSQKTALILFVFTGLGLAASSAVSAGEAQEARAKLVDRELSCISKVKSRQGAFTWNDVCYLEDEAASGSAPKSVNVVVGPNGEVTVGQKDAAKSEPAQKPVKKKAEKKSAVLTGADLDMEEDWAPVTAGSMAMDEGEDYSLMTAADRDRKKTSFEFGAESFHYDFDSKDGNSRYGNLFGVFGAVTYRLGPEEDLARSNNITMVKVDTHLAQDIDAFMFDGRGLAGFDFITANNTRFTPYTGIGYRYLRDKDAGDTEAIEEIYSPSGFYTNGAKAVKEEFKYLYIPIGFELNRPILSRWAVQLNCEFDVILEGRSTRRYNDLGPLIISGDDGSSHIPDAMEFNHDKGYGWRASVKFLRSAEEVDIYIEPFIRFWKLEDSDIEQFSTDGSGIIWYYRSTGEAVIDQVLGHKITEYGLRAGVLF